MVYFRAVYPIQFQFAPAPHQYKYIKQIRTNWIVSELDVDGETSKWMYVCV